MFRQGPQITGFKISGHAGLARKGRDICCAAVSAISQTALLGMLQQLDQEPRYEIKEGWLEVHLPEDSSSEDSRKAQIIFSTMEAGLQWIAADYPRLVRIK